MKIKSLARARSDDALKSEIMDACYQPCYDVAKKQLPKEERAEALGQSTLDLNAQYIDVMATITETFVRYEILKAADNLKRTKHDQPDLRFNCFKGKMIFLNLYLNQVKCQFVLSARLKDRNLRHS